MELKDSGARREFSTGAVRDIQDDKGRCDLLPLWDVGVVYNDSILHSIGHFMETGTIAYIEDAIREFSQKNYTNIGDSLLNLAKHFEDGAKKYATHKPIKQEDIAWEVKRELEKDASVRCAELTSSTARVCVEIATKRAYAHEIWNMFYGSEKMPLPGEKHTLNGLPTQTNGVKKTRTAGSEINEPNEKASSESVVSPRKVLKTFTPFKTTVVRSVEDLSLLLAQYTLTMTITQDGQEACYVVGAITESECWANLLTLCKKLSTTFRIQLLNNGGNWIFELFETGDRNWEKGIPCHCFVDSGVRHYIKFMAGWDDEPHDRAFLWNMYCLLWTLRHHPDLNDLPQYNLASAGRGGHTT